MSNENNNEAKVTDMTATENEIKATVNKYAGLHSDDLDEEQLREFCEALRSLAAMQEFKRNELSESNANLIAERETLMGQVMKTQELCDRVSRYWRKAEDKLKTVCAALEVVDPSEYMTGRDFIKKIAGI